MLWSSIQQLAQVVIYRISCSVKVQSPLHGRLGWLHTQYHMLSLHCNLVWVSGIIPYSYHIGYCSCSLNWSELNVVELKVQRCLGACSTSTHVLGVPCPLHTKKWGEMNCMANSLKVAPPPSTSWWKHTLVLLSRFALARNLAPVASSSSCNIVYIFFVTTTPKPFNLFVS